MSEFTLEELERIKELMEELNLVKACNKLDFYRPYKKQMEFHSLSAKHREVLLMGANQSGKTYCGAAEMAIHLTGRYPDWWTGKKFMYPIRAKAGSVDYASTRDGIQRNLLGDPEKPETWGTMALPKGSIVRTTIDNGKTKNFVTEIFVKHVSGGTSYLKLSAYSQGARSWQADKLDLVWFDEEPDSDIYSEGKTRTSKGNGQEYGYPESYGYVMQTFTPLLGMSEVVSSFYPELKSPDKALVQMGLYDVMSDPSTGQRGHYSKERVEQLLAGYEIWEREARGFGIPVLGEGAVFNVDWEDVLIDPFPIPKHFKILNGIDFGWAHPSAGVSIAIDPDAGEKGYNGTIYVTDVYKVAGKDSAYIASALRLWPGRWAWPHDGDQHEKGSGQTVASQYKSHGLDILPERATHDGKSNSLEASIDDCLVRFRNGQLKIFNTAANKGGPSDSLLTELRQYHRVDGKVVPLKDDAIAAMRYAIMMRRFAAAERDKPNVVEKFLRKSRSNSSGFMGT